MNQQRVVDVAIIGAGPSGSVAAALLQKQGLDVCVLERGQFPRFVIGESLLPYSMDVLEEAGLAQVVGATPGFQYKNGAAFTWGERYTWFDFTDKFTDGPGTTFQVQRAVFDQVLVDEIKRRGVDVRFGLAVTGYEELSADAQGRERARLHLTAEDGSKHTLDARFVLDASGYGRVLPRLLGLETPSCLPPRQAIFTHIDDHIVGDGFDRNKILISTHPEHRDIWSWLIPFSNGRASIGIVAEPARFLAHPASRGQAVTQSTGVATVAPDVQEAVLKAVVGEIPRVSGLLKHAVWDNGVPTSSVANYSANVSALTGRNFALLGNAAEFLDPVFSSGVTVALHSARLACRVLGRQLRGEAVDWQQDFVAPLKVGVEAFRTYVMGWYEGSFQDVIYCPAERVNADIRRMISAILAGYAWDESNPMVSRSTSRLKALAEICGPATLR